MTMSISSSRYLCNLIKWLPFSHQNYFINAIAWMGGKKMHYWKENSLVKMKKKEQLFWEWFGVDTTIWPSMKRNSKAKFFGNQKWRTSLFSCPSSSKPTYGTELFTHSPFIIQSDRSDNLQLPYTSRLEVIWDQIASDLLVYNLQLPYKRSSWLRWSPWSRWSSWSSW